MSYFITAINKEFLLDKFNDCPYYSSCFGYFNSLDDSIKAIEENRGNMNESGYYDHLILEQIGPGIHPVVNQIILFEWKDNKWTEVKMWPKWMEGMTNFALG